MYDYLIHGGTLVSGDGLNRADIAVRGERIVQLSAGLDPASARQSFDATGMLIFPGIIDVHSHPVYEDRFRETSLCAAYGGVTSMIYHASIRPGDPLIPTLEKYRDEGLKESVLDFGLHADFFDPATQVSQIPQMMKMGITSGKVFMTYAKLRWMSDDFWLMAIADLLSQEGGLLMVHAENGLATDYLEDKYLRGGKSMQDSFLATRPALLIAEAVNRAACIAHVVGCPLYIAHNSAALEVQVVRRLKSEGFNLFSECCPHHLCLNEGVYEKFGAQAKVGPAIRKEEDRLALWEALSDGFIDTVASDHAAKIKKVDDDFFQAPYGSPQVETMLPLVYDEGVIKNRISPERLARVMSENPARIFGLYPKKGAIQVGSDADITVFDPKEAYTIRASDLHSRSDYTLYEGRRCPGRPILTLARGRELLKGGEVLLPPGKAHFLSTKAGRADLKDLN